MRARCARGACAVRVLGFFRRPFHPEPIRGNGNASRAHQVPFTTPLPVDHLRGKLFKYLTRCGRGARAVRILPLGVHHPELMTAITARMQIRHAIKRSHFANRSHVLGSIVDAIFF